MDCMNTTSESAGLACLIVHPRCVVHHTTCFKLSKTFGRDRKRWNYSKSLADLNSNTKLFLSRSRPFISQPRSFIQRYGILNCR